MQGACVYAVQGWSIRPTAGLMHPRDFLNGMAFKCAPFSVPVCRAPTRARHVVLCRQDRCDPEEWDLTVHSKNMQKPFCFFGVVFSVPCCNICALAAICACSLAATRSCAATHHLVWFWSQSTFQNGLCDHLPLMQDVSQHTVHASSWKSHIHT